MAMSRTKVSSFTASGVATTMGLVPRMLCRGRDMTYMGLWGYQCSLNEQHLICSAEGHAFVKVIPVHRQAFISYH